MKADTPWIEHIAVIAHDLNGPITAVKGNIELIQLTGPLNEKQQRFAERALVSLTQMEQLVRMLLDVAWLDANKPLDPHDVEVGKLVSTAVSLLDATATRRKITLETDVDAETGTVKGDPQRLPQVINNLVNNAIKYNHEGGTVWVSTRGNADSVEIIVRDNGRGIPEEDLPNLFEQFFRVKPNAAGSIDGTGLGLAIVKAVVDKHNGTVGVTSAFNEGTTFTVMLPRVQPPAASAE
jgi:signal transduction histidine kinase